MFDWTWLKLKLMAALVVVVVALQAQTASASCYSCDDDPSLIGDDVYDPLCGDYDYHDQSHSESFGGSCFIKVKDDGYTERGISYVLEDTGTCISYGPWTQCYCNGNFCNTKSFCEQCGYPRPTPGSTTTVDVTTIHQTSDITTETLGKLKCYSCVDCIEIDEDTPVVEDEQYQSCFTKIYPNDRVVRGGSSDNHPNGECMEDSGKITCYCDTDLCNNLN